MRVGICTLAMSKLPLEDALTKAKAIGFDAVELWGKEPHSPVFFDAERVKEIRELADRIGIDIAVFGSYEYWLGGKLEPGGYDEALKKALAGVEITDGLGCKMMRVWSGYVGSEDASEEDWRLTIRGLKATADAASPRGITLVIEEHDRMMADRIEGIQRLFDEVAMPNLKLNFQPQYLIGSPEPLALIDALGPHIGHVHAGNIEALIPLGGGLKSAPIEGGFYDWGRIIPALARAGYDGCINVEHGGSDEVVAQQYASLRKLVDEHGA